MCVLAMPLPSVLLPLIIADVAAIFVALIVAALRLLLYVLLPLLSLAAGYRSIAASLLIDRMLVTVCPIALLW